ncbi:uncharacterized protein LOC6575383 isoform X2 [Drosophila mojavensis]|uniref:uncharacterized protein LOC6575383 isoform X2 n=1 Tax=Drosophila mojavensis TaxID=7230 RepID=UPI0013EE5603|nr:uncharacterized protein LOC6575383 isoform X2 [Drosophila mojavensis]
MLQQCIVKAPTGALGLNLSRAPWDPYPWVSGVQTDSNAQLGGICIGDTLLQLNGRDVLGLRISELAKRLREHWLTGADHVVMLMWRQQPTTGDSQEAAHVEHGINQQSLQKFATCLQHIAQLLECPVCCDVIKPPGWQCCNGHVLCNNCRNRSEKCPVCRVPLGPRGRCLLSDKLFTLLAENFPCDGVKSVKNDAMANSKGNNNNNNNNNDSGSKCTNEYHNQPKMALAKSNASKKCKKAGKLQMQLQLGVAGEGVGKRTAVEARAMPMGNEGSAPVENNVNVIKELRVESVLKEQQQKQQQDQQQQQQQQLEDGNNMLVKPKFKLSKKSWQITDEDQDELHSNEVANINNGQERALEVGLDPSRGVGVGVGLRLAWGPGQVLGPEKYQNYHCPTGKSCSKQLKLFQPAPSGGNKLSTAAQLERVQREQREQPEAGALPKTSAAMKLPLDATECLLQHLRAEHGLGTLLSSGTLGQRLHLHVQPDAQICLRLSELSAGAQVQEHTFFLAMLEISSNRYAVFLWHLDGEQHQFHTSIESPCKQLKWFGPAQPLTRSWSEISATGEYLTWLDKGEHNCRGFDIIVKRK